MRVPTKKEIYAELKDKYRFAWKGCGKVDSYFSQVKPLKAVILHPNAAARACVPVRSYKAPPGYKGNKYCATYEEFGYPGPETLPERYQNYLKKTKK